MIRDVVSSMDAQRAVQRLADVLDEAFRPESYGAKGDGVSDDFPAWQAMVADVNRKGWGRVECRPGAVYRWDRYRIDAGTEANGVQNPTLTDLTGFVLHGNGAKIDARGDFIRTNDNGGASYRNTLGLDLLRCTAVTLTDLEIDGNCDQTTKVATIEGYSHGLVLRACVGVRMRGIRSHHYPTDGLVVRDDGGSPSSVACKRVSAVDCEFDSNGRQGMSVTALRWGSFSGCHFTDTGRSAYGYHSPAGGVDIEPDRYPGHPNPLMQSDTASGDIRFRDCHFSNNVGSEFVGSGASAATIYPVRFEACHFVGTVGEASRVIHQMKWVSFTRCYFKDLEFKPAWAAPTSESEQTYVDDCVFENADPTLSVIRWLRNTGPELSSLTVKNSRFILTAPTPMTPTARIYLAAANGARLHFSNNRIQVAGTEHDATAGQDMLAFVQGGWVENNEWASDLNTAGGAFFGITYSNSTVRGDRFSSLNAFSPTGAVYAEEFFDQGRAGAGVLEVGDGTWTGSKRKVCFRTAAPTTGAWLKGDTVLNSNPASADATMGWRCTVAGTPGTWTTLHRISMVEAAAQADSVAADVATLKTDFNALLAKLRAAKLLG